MKLERIGEMTSGNGAKRKLSITKWLSTLGMIMLFIVLVFCIWSMAGGKNNEEHLASISLRCVTGIIGLAIAFHGKELVKEITRLVLAFKGIATGILGVQPGGVVPRENTEE